MASALGPGRVKGWVFPSITAPLEPERGNPPRVSALLLSVPTQPLTPVPCWEGDPGSGPDHLRRQNKWQKETQTHISQSNKTHLFQTRELPGSPRSCLVCSYIAYSALLMVDHPASGWTEAKKEPEQAPLPQGAPCGGVLRVPRWQVTAH